MMDPNDVHYAVLLLAGRLLWDVQERRLGHVDIDVIRTMVTGFAAGREHPGRCLSDQDIQQLAQQTLRKFRELRS